MTNLKELVKENSHGLKEVKFDLNNLLMQGSNEFVEPMEVLYTTYSLSIDFSRIYKDIYDEVIKNSDFTKNYPGNAEIIN